ncbi:MULTISPECIES: L,D-transpeptidase [Lentilactobacillus]|uniref:L,D-transpeptidase n=1 Tax=Lentilactobacillus TaxID=2767893 RepID=UPI0021A30857|nr:MULTISPECIES: L,D-transpeptidase [Lentilactobacillus]MDH5107323.1 L,D-transpeptidase [Lentilactobacillus diolivorans]
MKKFFLYVFLLIIFIASFFTIAQNMLFKKNVKRGQKFNLVKHRSNLSKPKSSTMRIPINWKKSSENLPYPMIKKYHKIWIYVSIRKQRMYIINKNKIIYTMYISTGIQDRTHATPRGVYHVQSERGKYFYSPSEKEGAYYWVSWLDHGKYLFHSVPTNKNKTFVKKTIKDLGVRPSSHGCVHLSLSDSKWIYQNIKYGTKVVIK